MNVSQPVAGRSRDVDATRAFFPVPVKSGTFEPSPTPSPSSPGWKLAYLNRIWKTEGPKGNTAKGVLTVLWRHSDDKGRMWIGLPLLAAEAGVGNLRTVRSALERLVQAGWLRYAPQTWSSLTAEQQAAGRPLPRRNNAGQAPHLYELLDGRGRPVTPTRPGLVRTSTASSDEHADATHGQNCPGGSEQNCPGETPAKLPYDPDPSGSVPKEVSESGAARAPSTHDFSLAQEGKGDWGWLESWQIVAETHAAKTKGAYGLAPMEPDVKQGDRKAMAECLDGAGVEIAAKLRARGMERELVEVRRELAERAMARYFRNDTPHLRKTKHALRDLPREWHARVTDAMQAILRESYDKQPVRRPVVLELEQKPTPLEQATEPRKAEKPAELASSAHTEKPLPKESIPMNTAREARKLMEVLAAAPSPEEPSKPTRPALPDWLVVEAEQQRARKQAQKAQKAPETPQDHRDESETIERPIVRPGAPRWGAIGPRPTKVRRPSRPVLEPEGTGEGDSSPSTE